MLCCRMKLGLNITGAISLILLITYLITLIKSYKTNKERDEQNESDPEHKKPEIPEINVFATWVWLSMQVIRVAFWLVSFLSAEVHKRN